jgi:5'-nucleotidase
MNILLTNDDGIDAQGVRTLARYLGARARVWVCAPKSQQSGTGHGITVRESLTLRDEAIDGALQAWSVEGKPADCVKLALISLLPEPVDLVVSGINAGTNLGTDTLYSGTVAGAMEGALYNLPAIALSLDTGGGGAADYEWAAQIGVALCVDWEAGALPIKPMSVLNVNIPNQPAGETRGFKAVHLGVPQYSDRYVLIEEARAFKRYRLEGERLPSRESDCGLDTVALEEGYITLTPLSAHMTDRAAMPEIEGYCRKD